MDIDYMVEAGFVLPNGTEYPDDWDCTSSDFEEAAGTYLALDLSNKRALLDNEGNVNEGEVLYKRLVAQKYDDEGLLADTAVIIYEDENMLYAPRLTTPTDIVEALARFGYKNLDDFLERVF